ncbi:MAG: YCF48-related protein [Candidatus Thorarchaeota archaeon]
MRQGIFQAWKNRLEKQTAIIGGLLLFFIIIWGLVSSMVINIQMPLNLYLEHTENPWQPISSETYPETGVETIDFVNSYHGWIAGENGTIMATVDGGKTWEEQHSGINAGIQDIDFFNINVGVAISWSNEILITQNGGETWIDLEKVTNPNKSKGIILWDVMTCDEHTAWVLGTGTFFKVDILNQNWTCILQISLYPRYLAMLNSSYGWATGGYGTIVKTTDGWQTYEIQDAGLSQTFYGIFFWDAHKGWVVGSDNTILATTDGGQHWHVQYTYQPFLADFVALRDIFFITELKGWAVGSYGIHYTKDGGKSWYNLGEKTWGPSRIAFANETHGWAVWSRKERSFTTSVGGVPPIDENLLNLGASFCISLPFLFIIALMLFQKYKMKKRKFILLSPRLCPNCGDQILPNAKFCVICGEPVLNDRKP